MNNLKGKWKYQSYRPDSGQVSTGAAAPEMVHWSPPGEVTINDDGSTGTLEFTGTPVQLALTLRASDADPAQVEISATMPLPGGNAFTNELTGWLVPSALNQISDEDETPQVVRGAIVQTSADIAPVNPQPRFTTGVFVLERA